MKIIQLKCENTKEGLITDCPAPRISFALSSEKKGAKLENAFIEMNGWRVATNRQILVPYGGEPLKPFSEYSVKVTATDSFGESDTAETAFQTGRMQTPWQAEWITDGAFRFKEKKVSPVPMVFRKQFDITQKIKKAVMYCTAIGVYKFEINGEKVGKNYFTPGFTSYRSTLQYQTYDITHRLTGKDTLLFTVAGGWAVGSFVFTRQNRVTANRQALLAELRVTYEDGSEEVIGTDETWEVTEEGAYRFADLYDGEVYDATVDLASAHWRKCKKEKLKISPEIIADYSAPVCAHEVFEPLTCNKIASGELVYDFGQNFAGIIRAKIKGKHGQKIVFRHGEILNPDGSPCVELLRSAKAKATYICKDGEQVYSPEFTYMGFRYVGVSGIDENDIELTAIALYSDLEETGSFECSDERINRLQQNIVWSSKSNFFDIPTDCPQRDERMGWTGDIAAFAPTACYNFDMSRFLEKWLKDLKSEQRRTGGIPTTVPAQGYAFPATMPLMAIDFWGDACLLVPWAEYLARGDTELLKKMYPVMKKYVHACKFWAGFFSVGKHRYIWHTPFLFHFGDWVAPYSNKMADWQKRSKWTATASLCQTSKLLSQIAGLLGEEKDEKYYARLSEKVAKSYMSVFTDGRGKLKKEFQTAYVLPLAFGMFPEEQRGVAAENLTKLIRENHYCIGTGFPGTPHILFALADNGKAREAFRMLFNEKCPSWLYEVKMGATTIWELWDALKEDGTANSGAEDGRGGMISYNHYASGAVGSFLYRRILGVEPTSGGYKTFKVEPLLCEELQYAKGETQTPYGKVAVEWKRNGAKFSISISVPVGAEAEVVLPDGTRQRVESGNYQFGCEL